MIPSIRCTGSTLRAFPKRALSTVGTGRENSLVTEALGALRTSVEKKPPPPTGTPTPTPVDPSLMDIPPAQDPLLQYLTSSLLNHGNRARASRITSEVLLHLHAFTRAPPLPILREAILRASPAVRTLMHRQGGKTIGKPVALGEKQRTRFAVKWILDASEKRVGRTVAERLAREMILVVEGGSKALEDKERVHRFAMVNRGNAQTRV